MNAWLALVIAAFGQVTAEAPCTVTLVRTVAENALSDGIASKGLEPEHPGAEETWRGCISWGSGWEVSPINLGLSPRRGLDAASCPICGLLRFDPLGPFVQARRRRSTTLRQ